MSKPEGRGGVGLLLGPLLWTLRTWGQNLSSVHSCSTKTIPQIPSVSHVAESLIQNN